MPTNAPHELTENAKDLLLEDYRYFADSFWKNEQTGETRVNWFIGIVTAAAGGLIGLTSADHRPHGESLRLIFIASFLALLAFGVITLFRIVKRNIVTDGYKRAMDVIREMFSEHLDAEHVLLQYHPFGRKEKDDGKSVARRLGGLTHTVSTINSLLLAGLAAALVCPLPPDGLNRQLAATYLSAIVAFVLAFIGQFNWVKRTDANAQLKLRLRHATHAGGIVYRVRNERIQYLIVGPQHEEKKAQKWVFPKGHIDPGEDASQAALREVREETGALARLICLVGCDEFIAKEKHIRATYYLMECFAEVEPEEIRRLDWFEYDEALKKLSHSENKSLLEQAEGKRRKLSGG